MKYLCLLHVPEDAWAPGTKGFEETVAGNMAARKAIADAGALVDCGPLQPTATATTVRVRDGEPLLTDGPYAELKEQLGGFYLLDCADLDEALRWAQTIPAARLGAVEVRPVMDTGGLG